MRGKLKTNGIQKGTQLKKASWSVKSNWRRFIQLISNWKLIPSMIRTKASTM